MPEATEFTPNDYSTVRRECREALYRQGIPSNPGFSDRNILEGISSCLGLSSIYSKIDDYSSDSGPIFRDTLGRLLGLELPPSTEDLVNAIKRIN